MLSEEQDEGEVRAAAPNTSPLQARHYLHQVRGAIDTPNKSQASPLDPFEEAERIAAMIKAECQRGTASPEQERDLERLEIFECIKKQRGGAQSPGGIAAGEDQRQDRSHLSPMNELSARHLVLREQPQGGSKM